MYYRKALELQAFLDMAKDEGIKAKAFTSKNLKYFIFFIIWQTFDFADLMKGYKAAELSSEEHPRSERSLWAQCQAVADMKYTYVVSCQQYGTHKRSGDPRAKDILMLMTTY